MAQGCSIDPTASMPEGMEYSVCAGEVQELAHCAIRAAELGLTEGAWRHVVSSLGAAGSVAAATEECMHDSGLWPWNSGGPGARSIDSGCAHPVGAEG